MFELSNPTIWTIIIVSIIIIIIACISVIRSLLLADKVREVLLESKEITIKGTVYSKRHDDSYMDITILIANEHKVPMLMFTEEDYNNHIEGDTLLLLITSTGSIQLIRNLSR